METTLDICHQEFHFADNSDSCGCCGFWKSKGGKKPSEYYVDKKGTIRPFNGTTDKVGARIRANKRLANLVQSKFESDPIESNEAFDRIRKNINFNLEGDERITEEKLIAIVNAIYEVKNEIKNGSES